MDMVRAFEEAAGAKVKFVHTPELARATGLPDHPGFDILSNDRQRAALHRGQGTGEHGRDRGHQ
jgi:hypothetical protein